MAQKRMFDKTITNSDEFIEMPDSSQNLYFHLSMNADDDGFVNNWKSIMRMTGHKDDDLKVLISKQFIIPFESGVIVIKHWRINNYLRSDRYVETKFKEEKRQLYTDNNSVYQLCTNGIHSIEENSIDKNRIDKNNIYSFIEENFGRTLSPIEYEQVSQWGDSELTRYAIKQAVLNGKYNLKYINAILNNWKKNRITTVKEAQQEIEKHNKPSKPEWFDKDIPPAIADKKTEEEFKKLLAQVRE